VLWTQQFPFARTIASYSDMESQVRAMLALHRKGELRPQLSASQMVADQFAPAACTGTIAQAWHDALSPQPPVRLAVETP
jgi:hypothetical protein